MRAATRRGSALLVLAALAGLAACSSEPEGPSLPTDRQLDGMYGDRATATLNGNVVDLRIEQPSRQLERGGRLWARVGPYIFLFSPQTRELFDTFSGVAAVRARTVSESDEWVAEATLRHDTLNPITWQDARRVVARARRQGTDKPGFLEDLIRFGEEHTEYRYNETFLQQ